MSVGLFVCAKGHLNKVGRIIIPDKLRGCFYVGMSKQEAISVVLAEPFLRRSLEIRLEAKIRRPDGVNGCWEWTAVCDRHGYGRIGLGPREAGMYAAHRMCFILNKGVIPDGLDLDHLCRNPKCVNPQHLDPVTRRINLLRGNTTTARHANTTHCPKGHAYTPENTAYKHKNLTTSRSCKQCNRDRSAVNRMKRKAC